MMTKDEIVRASFQVWGERFYRTTSLSHVAASLGITKPALYRYFTGKDALLDAMYADYFDRFAAALRPAYQALTRQASSLSECERCLLLARATGEFYARSPYDLIFAVVNVFGSEDNNHNLAAQMASRGLLINEKVLPGRWESDSWLSAVPASPARFVMEGLFVDLMHFFRRRFLENRADDWAQALAGSPEESEVAGLLSQIEKQVRSGLGFSRECVLALDYPALEAEAASCVSSRGSGEQDEKLLAAVAGVLAEGGPTSMERVARKSGLSKSSLYSHFSGKLDMFKRFFQAQFARIIDCAEAACGKREAPQERLYLALRACGAYLEANPEILAAMDWIWARRMVFMEKRPSGAGEAGAECALEPDRQVYRIFSRVVDERGKSLIGERETDYILSLLVHTLLRRPAGERGGGEVSGEALRELFRFVCLGVYERPQEREALPGQG